MNIDRIVETISDRINHEPTVNEDEQEEYLDRLGVDEDQEETTTLGDAIRATMRQGDVERQHRIDERVDNDTEPISYYNENSPIQEHSMGYGSPSIHTAVDGASIEREHRMPQTDYINWSNGDHEVRPRLARRQPNQHSTRSFQFRHHTSEFVHEQVRLTKHRLVDFILQDIERLVYDFMQNAGERLPASPDDTVVIEALVGHYIEDMGDDIILRGRCRCYFLPTSFSPMLKVELEMPGTEVRTFSLDMDMIRYRR